MCLALGNNPSCDRLSTTVLLALRNLTLHKFRVLLNLLGLIFGVSSVIAMHGDHRRGEAKHPAPVRRPGSHQYHHPQHQPDDEIGLSQHQTYDGDALTLGVTYADLVASCPLFPPS